MTHRWIIHAREVIAGRLAGRDWRAQWCGPPTRPSQGCFVSLKTGQRLRGCIGTLQPVRPTLEEEIAENALAAAFRDPRFSPLRSEELGRLRISIDLLEPFEAVASPDDLDPAVYGLVLRNGKRSGVLLPDIPSVTSVARQIEICREKAELKAGESYTLSRFRVMRFEE